MNRKNSTLRVQSSWSDRPFLPVSVEKLSLVQQKHVKCVRGCLVLQRSQAKKSHAIVTAVRRKFRSFTLHWDRLNNIYFKCSSRVVFSSDLRGVPMNLVWNGRAKLPVHSCNNNIVHLCLKRCETRHPSAHFTCFTKRDFPTSTDRNERPDHNTRTQSIEFF